MAANPSALVLVHADDSVEAVVDKIRATGAADVQLLVPDDTESLQVLGGFARLRQYADRHSIAVMVISSDDRTLNAARLNQFDTVGVEGARVSFAAPDTTLANPFSTQVLTAEAFGAPTAPDDAEFLDALDRIPEGDGYALPPDDPDRFIEPLDDVDAADNFPVRRRTSPLDSQWEQPFEAPRPRRYAEQAPAPPARSRDLPRRRSNGRTAELEALIDQPQRGRARRYEDDETFDEVRPRRQSQVLFTVLAVVLALLLIGGVWLFLTRPTVAVGAPQLPVREFPFENQIIPLAGEDTASDAAAVQAVAVSASAEASVQGQASQQQTPVGVARGAVQIINTLPNPIELPAGTEFIGSNDQGEVRFLLDSPATIPPSVTASSLTGTSTTFGSLEVQVSARSPGSASNVPENTITQIAIPGQPAISSGDAIRLVNGPITGGSEDLAYVVSQDDVQRVLGDALTQLYRSGVAELQNQQLAEGIAIDDLTVSPKPEELGNPINYEQPIVDPPVGQVVTAGSPTFTVTVRATFTALATPRGNPVSTQLNTVAPTVISQRRDNNLPCASNESLGFPVRNWRWDGQQLTIDGAITCLPQSTLSDETLAQVRDAVLGQSYAAADASLRQMQQQGQIGEYKLPPVGSFPRFGFLLNLDVLESGGTTELSGTAPAASTSEATTPEATTPEATTPLEGATSEP